MLMVTEYRIAFPVLDSNPLLLTHVIYSVSIKLIPTSSFILPSHPHFPFANHKFYFEIYGSVSVLLISFLCHFYYISHRSDIIRYLSFSVRGMSQHEGL